VVDYTVRFRCAFLCPKNRLTERHATLVTIPHRRFVGHENAIQNALCNQPIRVRQHLPFRIHFSVRISIRFHAIRMEKRFSVRLENLVSKRTHIFASDSVSDSLSDFVSHATHDRESDRLVDWCRIGTRTENRLQKLSCRRPLIAKTKFTF
jgi:hypothetical protein